MPRTSTELPDHVQMIGHYDRSIDNESIRRMQPANGIKHDVGVVLFRKKLSSTGNGCG